MKFLLDVCVSSRSLQAFLAGRGHDVASALSMNPVVSDEELLDIALREDRVLITQDKDFGELVFVRKLPHGPIVRIEAQPAEPVHVVRDGAVAASIWLRQSLAGLPYFEFSLSRSWKSLTSGKTGYSKTFFSRNRSELVSVTEKAAAWIEQRESELSRNASDEAKAA